MADATISRADARIDLRVTSPRESRENGGQKVCSGVGGDVGGTGGGGGGTSGGGTSGGGGGEEAGAGKHVSRDVQVKRANLVPSFGPHTAVILPVDGNGAEAIALHCGTVFGTDVVQGDGPGPPLVGWTNYPADDERRYTRNQRDGSGRVCVSKLSLLP